MNSFLILMNSWLKQCFDAMNCKRNKSKNYSIKDWNFENYWNNEEKLSSFHLSFHEEFE